MRTIVSGCLYSESFTVAKISSGSSVIDKSITIDRSIAIAPVSGEEVIITAGVDQSVFDITGGGELTLGGGGGTVTIDGGEIDAPNGSSSLITVGPGGTLNITEGTAIQNNRLSAGNGGGITVNGRTVEMTGGTITNCQGENFGGGVHIAGANSICKLTGGAITTNKVRDTYSNTRGGGISITGYLNSDNTTSYPTFCCEINNISTNGIDISGNQSLAAGGGSLAKDEVYIKAGVHYATTETGSPQTLATNITTVDGL